MAALIAVTAPIPAVQAADRAWVQRALGLQYELAGDVALRNAPWIYTHNSFNSPAEMGPGAISSKDPNQKISIVDQLDEGVRHLEIDTHLFPSPSDPRVGALGPVVCHALNNHGGCSAEKPLYVVLGEVRGWLRAHPSQVVMIYLESHLDTAAGYDAGADEVQSTLGDVLYKPRSGGRRCDPLPLELTRDQMRAAHKQVLAFGPCGEGTRWRGLVHDESLRVTGSPNAGLRDFPDCGPDFTRAEYQAKPIRYYEDSTQLSKQVNNGRTDPVTVPIVQRMTRCGVDLIGFDQLVRGDPRLEAEIWSWAPGEPSEAGPCAVQRADGRWQARACTQRHRAACRDASGGWRISRIGAEAGAAARLCGRPGLRSAVPRTGYEGQLLRVAAARAGAGSVWLGLRSRGGSWKPVEPRGCGPTLRRARRRWPVHNGVARFVARIRFTCTGETLHRRVVVRGGRHSVRSRLGHRIRVRVSPHTRRLRVRYRYAGRRRTALVLLARR